MTVRLHWFLPTTGDDRDVVGVTARDSLQSRTTTRPPTLDYLAQVARAAESAGFEAVLTPTGSDCEDSWLTTAALLPQTTRLKFLVAFRPGVIAPPLAAQMTATYQRLSGGRLLLNVVTGSDADEQRAYGDFLSHDERYARTGEFLDLLRTAWSGDPYDYEGAHYRVAGGRLRKPPAELPPVFFGGSSQAALPVAAKYADTYLTWGEPPAAVAQKIGRVRELAEAEGRELSYGIRLHVISRDTAAEAWAEADRILDSLDPAAIKAAHERFRTRSRPVSGRWPRCPGAVRTGWRSTPTSGPGSVLSGPARAPHWSAAMSKSPSASRSSPRSASSTSSSPGNRTWRRRSASGSASDRCWPANSPPPEPT
jgi:alkanesulfonate monooxygenase